MVVEKPQFKIITALNKLWINDGAGWCCCWVKVGAGIFVGIYKQSRIINILIFLPGRIHIISTPL